MSTGWESFNIIVCFDFPGGSFLAKDTFAQTSFRRRKYQSRNGEGIEGGEEDHRVTAVPAVTQSVTSVRSQELHTWDKNIGFAASKSPLRAPAGSCAEDAMFTF